MKSKAAIRKGITAWGVLILLGVVAYGLGLYQGSNLRASRSIASVYVISAPEQAPSESKAE